MDVQQITKITLAWELYEREVPKTHIAARLEVNRDTVRLWIQGIQKMGLVTFLEQYEKAKKGERPRRQVGMPY